MRTLLIVVAVLIATGVGAVYGRVRLAHIQLPAEPVMGIGSFPITNTMVAGWMASLLVLFLFWRGSSGQRVVPSGLQNFAEMLVEFMLGLCENIAGRDRGRRFFPYIATIFFFVITSNWMGLVPGFGGTIEVKEWHAPGYVAEKPAAAAKEGVAVKAAGAKEAGKEAAKDDDHAPAADDGHGEAKVPLFRAATSDLNTTLAIALVSVLMTQVFGLSLLKGEYVGRFFNFKGGPIGFYVGLLELVGEFAKIVSFTFRLFGNIFAGEVLLAVIVFLLPWVVVLPFLGLELFVGFIQAYVFAVLTLVFMTMATTSHEHHDAHAEHSGAQGSAHPQGAGHH